MNKHVLYCIVLYWLNLKGAGRVEGCSALGGCYLKNRKRGPLDVRLGLEPVSDDEDDVSISILEKIMILCLGPQASTLTQVQRGALGRSSTEIPRSRHSNIEGGRMIVLKNRKLPLSTDFSIEI